MEIYHLEQEALFSSIKHRKVKERTQNKPQTKTKTLFKSRALSLLSPIWECACILFCNVIKYCHMRKWLEEIYLQSLK